jgi:glutamate dehydrogenase (NAD(P)+)
MVSAAARYKESPVDVASWNFAAACGRISLDADLKTLLAMPYRELSLQLPLRLDDGTLRVYRASRVLHSNVRGPAAGTITMRPGATPDLALALANFATWTSALMGVPFGGASAVIDCDPATLSPEEYGKLLRRFASRSHLVLGPFQDVVIASSADEAAALLDEYSSLHGFTPASVTGKNAEQGGVAGFDKASPRAATLSLREAATRSGRGVEGLCVAIVANPKTLADYAAELTAIGCIVVAASDGSQTVCDEHALSPTDLFAASDSAVITNGSEAALFADCDVLVLAGAECSLHAANASRVRAKTIIEAAPLNVTVAADVALRQQRATVIPDLIAASGATIAAHAEWAANLEDRQLHSQDVDAALEKAVCQTMDSVIDRVKKDNVTPRSAAYCIAVERVARTERLRGI